MDQSFVNLGLFVTYVVQAIAFYKLGEKAGLSNNWIAFIPILQFIIFFHLIDKSAWNILFAFIPVVNVVLAVIWYLKFLEVFGMSKAWVLAALFGLSAIPTLIAAFSRDVEYVYSNRFTA